MLLNFSVSRYCVEQMHYWNCLKEFQMDNPDEKKRKRKTIEDSVYETLAKWKEYNGAQLESCAAPKVPAKGSTKRYMKGKGGPENSQFHYRGVTKRTWDKWMAEICSRMVERDCGLGLLIL